jgi:hypothetical protein
MNPNQRIKGSTFSQPKAQSVSFNEDFPPSLRLNQAQSFDVFSERSKVWWESTNVLNLYCDNFQVLCARWRSTESPRGKTFCRKKTFFHHGHDCKLIYGVVR